MKECFSTNDVLNRGPVMLPKLRNILLRFRNVAIASDVEKAFLQVRLQAKDKDATRFFWLRDETQPAVTNNTITYRFNRVTFGLICFPFFLAGTIKYHPMYHVKNSKLAKEIKESTYMDNVIVTAPSTEDAVQMYKDSKSIFKEMNMNFREFISNDKEFEKEMAKEDLSEHTIQKILGIQWDSSKDKFCLSCSYPYKDKITKRTVSEQVAAIYDPHGWLSPITLPGKQFLQKLWALGYDWDTTLLNELQAQWKEILQKADGFRCEISRKLTQIGKYTRLVVF